MSESIELLREKLAKSGVGYFCVIGEILLEILEVLRSKNE